NASDESFHREERIRQHLELARQQVQTMNDADAEEKVSRIAQGRLRAAKEKQHRLELALKELKALQQQQSNSQRNSCQQSEPEARVMRQSGFAPGYNVQISTDAAHGIVVAVEATRSANDYEELKPA